MYALGILVREMLNVAMTSHRTGVPLYSRKLKYVIQMLVKDDITERASIDEIIQFLEKKSPINAVHQTQIKIEKSKIQSKPGIKQWVPNIITNEDSPINFATTKLVINAVWTKPKKLEKFYTLIKNQNIFTNPAAAMKACVSIQMLLFFGPMVSLTYPKNVCSSLKQNWKKIQVTGDPHPAISSMILAYTDFLLLKLELLNSYGHIIDGNYAPLVQLYFPNCNFRPPIQKDFMKYLYDVWGHSIGLHQILTDPSPLLKQTRLGAALTIMREENNIVSLYTHTFRLLKSVQCFDDIAKTPDQIRTFCERFSEAFAKYFELSAFFFKSMREKPELAAGKDNIRELPLQVIMYLKNYKFPECAKDYKYYIEQMQPEKEIFGLYVPKANRQPSEKIIPQNPEPTIKPVIQQQKMLINQDPPMPTKIIPMNGDRGVIGKVQNKEEEKKIKKHYSHPDHPQHHLFSQENKAPSKTDSTILNIKETTPTLLKPIRVIEIPRLVPALPKPCPPIGPAPGSSIPEMLMKELGKSQDSFLIDIKEVKRGALIGEGASAQVYKGNYRGTDVAIKIMRSFNADPNSNASKDLKRELNTLSVLRHPNLVLFMGISYTSDGRICIITEFCSGGNIFKILHESPYTLSWKQRKKMALDIAKGMNFLHSNKPPIIHRDLKSLNLLLSEPVTGPADFINVKITDFGLARYQERDQFMTGNAGTFHWMAPEVLMNESYDTKADVFSFGIVLWEILSRNKPYNGMAGTEVMYRVMNSDERPKISLVSPDCPPLLKGMMQACWQRDPAKRPPFEVIIQALTSNP